ncbi:MFS transporter [Actinomyces radicidentis]|uniref:MFS transporter n=1 Tax=Actinomyces radicidentis TaxID=111015 RepID=UPI0028E68EAA|nr:MFS transporter [Actinomyces radicidentis]
MDSTTTRPDSSRPVPRVDANAEKRARKAQEKADRTGKARAARAAQKAERERRRLANMRRRRRLREGDVTVVEEAALRKAILGAVVGNIMEWYDVGVYAFVSVLIGRAFLPDASTTAQNLFSLGVFAVTFVARPLGGVILGSLGDRMGRKEILAFTLTMMALATFGIGVLPPASAIGAAAPILLVCLKLVQGFSTGGEYAGATTFVTEYSPDKKRGFYAALLDLGSYLGNAMGAGFATILMVVLPEDVMATWGWRVPFLLALPMGAIALYIRSHIEDTPAFQDARGEDGGPEEIDLAAAETDVMKPEEGPLPFGQMVRTYWRELGTAIVLVAGANTVGYALTSYIPTYLTSTLGYDAVHGTLLTIPILVLVALLIPAIGLVADYVGHKPVLWSAALATIVLTVPAFQLMQRGTMLMTFLGLLLLSYPVAAYVGNLAATLPAVFPTVHRYSGMGISYNIAVAAFGGTTAFIMEAISSATHSATTPALWIISMSTLAFFTIFRLKETARRPLPGSMPAVASAAEVAELVETQEENPDLDVAEMFAAAPVHLVDQDPSVAEAEAEVAVALAAEEKARAHLLRAESATAAARQAVVAARKRETGQMDRIDAELVDDGQGASALREDGPHSLTDLGEEPSIPE